MIHDAWKCKKNHYIAFLDLAAGCRFESCPVHQFSGLTAYDPSPEKQRRPLTYPRDVIPHIGLAFLYRQLGQFEDAIREAQETLRLGANQVMPYGSLAYAYLNRNRLDEAKAIIAQATSRGMEPWYFHEIPYQIAFIQGDSASMKGQVEWAKGSPGEYSMRSLEASAAASSGQLILARHLF